MTTSIPCPHCRHPLQAPANVGAEVRCPECGNVLVSSAPTGITAHPHAAPTEVQPGPPPMAGRWREDAIDDDDVPRIALPRPPFKPGGNLALTLKIFLGLYILACVALVGGNGLQYGLALRLVKRENVPLAEIAANDDRQALLAFAVLGLYIATAPVFLCWFYRVHANLKALGAHDLTFQSNWAVGGWFIPLANLWRPLQVAQEVWRHSDPDAVTRDGIRREPSANSTLLSNWWAAWIGSGVVAVIATQMGAHVHSPEALRDATAVAIGEEALAILTGILAFAVVSAIDARQTARAQALDAPAPAWGDEN